MAIPRFNDTILTVLESYKDGQGHTNVEVVAFVVQRFKLTGAERELRHREGAGENIVQQRVSSAQVSLRKAKLIESKGKGLSAITPLGLDLLQSRPKKITSALLKKRYPDYAERVARPNKEKLTAPQAANFEWVAFYQEFADKLLQFKNNRARLIAIVKAAYEKSNVPNNFKTEPNLFDICPFTVMATFNRSMKDANRIALLTEYAKLLKIKATVPRSFAGVPVLDPRQSWFFVRGTQNVPVLDIDIAWDLFETCLRLSDKQNTTHLSRFAELFDTTISAKGIKWNLTIALFWIRPSQYLALDANNRTFLNEKLSMNYDLSKPPNGMRYLEICDEVRTKLYADTATDSFAAMSHDAWTKTRDEEKQTEVPTPEKTARYWIFSPGAKANKWDEFRATGMMAMDYGVLVDLRSFSSREEVAKVIEQSGKNSKVDSLTFWEFLSEMQIGDIVYAKKGMHQIIGRGLVTSEYFYDETRSTFRHVRKVQWTHTGQWELCKQVAMKTLTNYTDRKDWCREMEDRILSDKNATSESEYLRDEFVKFMEFRGYKQVTISGYERALRVSCEKLTDIHFEQPDLFYQTQPDRFREAFKSIRSSSKYDEVNYSGNGPLQAALNLYQTFLTERQSNEPAVSTAYLRYSRSDFLREVYMSDVQYGALCGLLKRKKNIILQGAPGVGKSFLARRLAYSILGVKDSSKVATVQFHQSYSYEDFIEGYRPKEGGGFENKKGKFYYFCKEAKENPDEKYFFIIDEINRGNLSKIMGELMLLLEHDKRGAEFATTLMYSGEEFWVPANVHIIGMMNTADRSIAMMDYALRRRFSFVPVVPAFEHDNFQRELRLKCGDAPASRILASMEKLNELIKGKLDDGHQIGHSYFCTDKDAMTADDINSIFTYEIKELLKEYFFDDTDSLSTALKHCDEQ